MWQAATTGTGKTFTLVGALRWSGGRRTEQTDGARSARKKEHRSPARRMRLASSEPRRAEHLSELSGASPSSVFPELTALGDSVDKGTRGGLEPALHRHSLCVI